MMHPFSQDPLYVELHLRELRAKAAQDRLVYLARQADRAQRGDQLRRWRQRLGALLITTGEAIVGQPVEVASPDGTGGICYDGA
jgi:hypothetical protein